MMVCRVCKTENDDRFMYCKNCGTQLDKPKNYEAYESGQFAAQPVNVPNRATSPIMPVAPTPDRAIQENTLVSVYMSLPDPIDPSRRSLQRVYVTRKQMQAMEAAGMFSSDHQNG